MGPARRGRKADWFSPWTGEVSAGPLDSRRVTRARLWVIGAVVLGALASAAPGSAQLLRSDNTPFLPSRQITGAVWTSRRYAPPANQVGDILPTVWSDDGTEYTMIDDGESDQPANEVWKQSLARITGVPPRIRFSHVGDPAVPAPHTFGEIRRGAPWGGPLGPFYSSGLVEADGTLYATQENDWAWGSNGPFTGLAGIASSRDHGLTWTSGGKPFPAPLGNLSWVIRGRGGHYADGWVYALATEREFNADRIVMGRARPDVGQMVDPAQWQWIASLPSGRRAAAGTPRYTQVVTGAGAILRWPGHITYPQMAYDAPLHRYLLTITYSYAAAPPGIWRSGAELVLLDAPNPWGPFTFVAREPEFGPSNGYGAGFPLSWISRDGRTLWMKWAANFDGCSARLDCSGAYGFNYRRLRLAVGR